MEQTPFDPRNQSGTLPTAPPQNGSSPSSKKRNFVPLLLLVPILGATGFWWNDQNQKRIETEMLKAIRANLKSIVLQDNALALEMLDEGASQGITFAEWFKRAEKNKENRDDLIRQMRSVEADIYAPQAKKFVELMETEQTYVRVEEARTRASLAVSSKFDGWKEALDDQSDAVSATESARDAYMSAPYGSDFDEKLEWNAASAKARSTSEWAKGSYDALVKARTDLKTRQSETISAATVWLQDEFKLYPAVFAPPRDVVSFLKTKRRELGGTDAAEVADQGVIKPFSTSGTTNPPVTPATPTATPRPAVPSRVKSLDILEGERFPMTRMQDMTYADVSGLSDDDLRYAINEMYARYGLTFKNKDYQANFDELKWYQPNGRWTMPQITTAFNAREKTNLRLLTDERNARRSSGY